jgi:hypothetical protein
MFGVKFVLKSMPEKYIYLDSVTDQEGLICAIMFLTVPFTLFFVCSDLGLCGVSILFEAGRK